MSRFLLSAFADEYAPSTEDQLVALTQLGIDYIELRYLNETNISLLSTQEIKETKKKLDHYGIKASAIGSPLGKVKLDSDLNAHLETARRVFSSANILETKFVRIFSFYAPEGESIEEKKDQVLEALEQLVSLARQFGVTLCHENEAKIYGSSPQRCLELLKHFQGELKCVFDMGNFVLEEIRPYPEAYGLLKEYVAYFHIKDALYQGAIVPPGKGEAQIEEILSAHRQFSREPFFVSLEPHLQTFSGLNALVGRSFENPYQYPDAKTAFIEAVEKFKELMK